MAGISPDDTFTYWLPDDRSKPESERRGLVYRHGTAGQWRKFSADYRTAVAKPTCDFIEAIGTLAEQGLVRRENIPEGKLEDLLTYNQLFTIARDLPTASLTSEQDKKKSPSQSPTDAGKSAPNANPASA